MVNTQASGMNAASYAKFHVVDDGSGTGPALLCGGSFTTAGGVTANRIAKWHPSSKSWSSYGTGMNDIVYGFAEFDDGSGNGSQLHAAGYFRNAGGAIAHYIAKWNGSQWSPLESFGLTAGVDALAVFTDTFGTPPSLFIAGGFTNIGELVTNNIAKWDGHSLSTLDGGTNGGVYVLHVFDDGFGGGPALYAGGNFTAAGGVPANFIAFWNGDVWTPLGLGVNAYVNGLAVFDDGDGASLYAAGGFTNAGGVDANFVAKWDGKTWSPLGDGPDADTYALAVFDDGSGSGPALYAAGGFNNADGIPANHIAKWNGDSWSALGTGIDGSVYTLAVFDDGLGDGPALYAGGFFANAGGSPAKSIAKWNGTTWSPVGEGLTWFVKSMTVFDDGSGTGPSLFAGGDFTAAGGVPVSRIAKWNGTTWSALGSGVNSSIYSLAAYDDGGGGGPALFAGGSFTASPAGDSFLAKWGCPSSLDSRTPIFPASKIVGGRGMGTSPSSAHSRTHNLRLRPGESLLIGNQVVRLGSLYAEAGSHISIAHPDAHLIVENMTIEAGVIFEWIAGTIEIAGGTWLHPEAIRIGCNSPRGPGSSQARLVLSGGGTAVVDAPHIYVCNPGAIEGEGTILAGTTNSGTVLPRGIGLTISAEYDQQPDGVLVTSPRRDPIDSDVAAPMLRVDGEAVLSGALRANPVEPLECGDSFVVIWAQQMSGDLDSVLLEDIHCANRITVAFEAQSLRAEIKPNRDTADMNCDGVVDVNDIVIMLGSWGACANGCCHADLFPDPHGDGLIDVEDLLEVMARIEAAAAAAQNAIPAQEVKQ